MGGNYVACVCVCFCKTNGSVLSAALCDGNYFHRPPLLKWRAKRMNGRRRAKAPPPGFLNLGAPQARSGCLGFRRDAEHGDGTSAPDAGATTL